MPLIIPLFTFTIPACVTVMATDHVELLLLQAAGVVTLKFGKIHGEYKAASTVNTSFLAGFNGFTVTASLKPVVGLKSESVASVPVAAFCLVEMVQPAGKADMIIT